MNELLRGKRETTMHVIAARPHGTSTMVDVEIAPGIRLFNLKLSSGPDGSPRLHAPNAFGTRTATFDSTIIQAVAAAVEPFGHDRHRS